MSWLIKRYIGDIECDCCGVIMAQCVPEPSDSIQYDICDKCKKSEREVNGVKIRIGSRVEWGCGAHRGSGTVAIVHLTGDIVAVAYADGDNGSTWYIRDRELTNEIGGVDCWTRIVE